jgi:negative regulator of flagellin synthesis FlgM
MGIEIGNGGRTSQETLDAGKAQIAQTSSSRPGNPGGATPPPASGEELRLSDKAAQLQALEAGIANLPVVDTQRVQEVQRTIATGSFEIQPARVADKLLRFEAGLGKAS